MMSGKVRKCEYCSRKADIEDMCLRCHRYVTRAYIDPYKGLGKALRDMCLDVRGVS